MRRKPSVGPGSWPAPQGGRSSRAGGGIRACLLPPSSLRPRHQPGIYLKTPAWLHFKNRASWVVGPAALGIVSGLIIHHFEASLVNLLILALYMPMVAGTGGHAGSQSATVVVRALALGEVTPGDALRVLWKELQVVTATVIGALLPLIAARFKLDPAVVASPALTTVVDITGLLTCFTSEKLPLGI